VALPLTLSHNFALGTATSPVCHAPSSNLPVSLAQGEEWHGQAQSTDRPRQWYAALTAEAWKAISPQRHRGHRELHRRNCPCFVEQLSHAKARRREGGSRAEVAQVVFLTLVAALQEIVHEVTRRALPRPYGG